MEALKRAVENRHREARENSFTLWSRVKDQPKGLYLIKCATLEEFNKRTDFLSPEYYPLEKIGNLHSSITDYATQYLPSEGFIYVIAIDQLPAGYPYPSILSPQLVYKHADRD